MKIKTTVEVEVEVKFPFYATDGLHYFRIDENGCLMVKYSEKLFTSIDFTKYYPESYFAIAQCTEKEFLTAYTEAQSYLTVMYHNLFSKSNEFIKQVSND